MRGHIEKITFSNIIVQIVSIFLCYKRCFCCNKYKANTEEDKQIDGGRYSVQGNI